MQNDFFLLPLHLTMVTWLKHRNIHRILESRKLRIRSRFFFFPFFLSMIRKTRITDRYKVKLKGYKDFFFSFFIFFLFFSEKTKGSIDRLIDGTKAKKTSDGKSWSFSQENLHDSRNDKISLLVVFRCNAWNKVSTRSTIIEMFFFPLPP